MRRHSAQFAACWIFGLCAGALTAVRSDFCFFSLMRRSIDGSVSIVWSLTAVLPFLMTAAAVLYHKRSLVYPAACIAGFVFGLVGQSFYLALGCAGWLLQPMMLFSGTALAAIYVWFGLRCCPDVARNDLCVCIVLSAAAVIIDFFAVSPFIAMLFDF